MVIEHPHTEEEFPLERLADRMGVLGEYEEFVFILFTMVFPFIIILVNWEVLKFTCVERLD